MSRPGEDDRRQSPSPEDEFLQAYWRDLDRNQVRPAEEYLARFPSAREAILRELEEVPRLVDKYQLTAELGKGAQGTVWSAFDLELRRPVALKLFNVPDLDASYQRFLREAMVVARLNHPGICTVYGSGSYDQGHYIAMQLVSGQSLLERISRPDRPESEKEWHLNASANEDPPWPKVDSAASTNLRPRDRGEVVEFLNYFASVARILDYAHREGVVHRDLKPGNLMIQDDGRPVILDFGLARDLDPATAKLTQTGDVLGTPAYMSPEQIEGIAVDFATDIWSLGVTAYEALCGRRPFCGETRRNFMRAVIREEPELPSTLHELLDDGVDRVLLKALAKSPRDRYASASQMAADLEDLARGRPPLHSSAGRPLIVIRHERSALEGQVQRFRRSRILLGRARDCDVAFDPRRDILVSGTHAEITLADGRLILRDKGSRNGTYKDGRRVSECDLSSGDVVVLGDPRSGPLMRVEFEGGLESPATGILPTQSS